MQNAPPRNPCAAKKVQQKVLGPMQRMGEIQPGIFLADEHPSSVFVTGLPFVSHPRCPNTDGEPVRIKNETGLPPRTRSWSLKSQSPEILGKFHVRERSESSPSEFPLKSIEAFNRRQNLFRHNTPPSLFWKIADKFLLSL